MRIKKERKAVIPPESFDNYEWDDDFKLMMFCLEFTRNYLSGDADEYTHKITREWGYKNPGEIYDLLWFGFKYYKGQSFNNKFSIIESNVDCPRCHNHIRFAEVKPMGISSLIQGGKK